MDIRPIGFAVWIASVVTVAACSPRGEERAAADIETSTARDAAARAAATRQQSQSPAGMAAPSGRVSGEPARAGVAPTSSMGASPATSAAAGAVDDAQITARVKASLAAARDLSGARIDVDTRDGVVTLSGAVGTAAVKA